MNPLDISTELNGSLCHFCRIHITLTGTCWITVHTNKFASKYRERKKKLTKKRKQNRLNMVFFNSVITCYDDVDICWKRIKSATPILLVWNICTSRVCEIMWYACVMCMCLEQNARFRDFTHFYTQTQLRMSGLWIEFTREYARNDVWQRPHVCIGVCGLCQTLAERCV